MSKNQLYINSNLKKKALKLHPIAREALKYLYQNKDKHLSNPPQEIITGAQLLEQDKLSEVTISTYTIIELDTLGKQFVKTDLPEIQVLKKLQDVSKTLTELGLSQEIITAALGELKRNKLVDIKKEKEMVLTPTSRVKIFLKNYSNPLKIFVNVKTEQELTDEQKIIVQNLLRRKGFIKKSQKNRFQFI